ncbi:MAG: divalent metal cation transporter [Pseudomonadota bacterium]
MSKLLRYRPGPALLVTAAFIGPGTVTTASIAGASYGFALLWALVFATIATIILQNMAGTIGIIRRQGLAEAMLGIANGSVSRIAIAILLLVALGIGNAAYEAGNIGGAVIGLELVLDENALSSSLAIILVALLSIAALLTPNRQILTGLLTVLVLVMSLAFLTTALMGGIDLSAMAKGLLPTIPDGATLRAIALIGTTIVPYNLFLHAALARQRWNTANTHSLNEMRADTIGAVGLGGLVSIAILSTAATHMFANGMAIENPADMARQIGPLAGSYAPYLLGIGLFAAGLTSAITAPLATGIILAEIAGSLVPQDIAKSKIEKAVAIVIVFIGAAVAITGTSLIAVIVTAQAANGLLLPIVAIMLFRLRYHDDETEMMIEDNIVVKLAALAVIAITLLLGGRLVASSLGFLG